MYIIHNEPPEPSVAIGCMTMERILAIDDDVALCELLADYLVSEGFEVESTHDGETGLEAACDGGHDLIVLDVMLPGMNGFEVLRHLRGRSDTPVIMLTARGETVDRIVGLEIGADDYLAKPFNPRELVARIRAILRRMRLDRMNVDDTVPETLKVGDVEMHITTRLVLLSGGPVNLTAMEFSLLELLLRNAGRLVPREELIRSVLGRTPYPYDRSIDVHVSRIRKKLGREVDGTERIKTIRNVGYLYALTAPAPARTRGAGGPQE
jgi:two-component system response regulator CpxR